GGITGAGIALDAASRGIKVALIEMRDFASGTSSKSTKLIHGGLRYLAQLDIGLVREVGRERAIVHRLAPHLVLAKKMLMPIVEGGTYGKWSTAVGLSVYDFLAEVKGDDKRKMLSKQETTEKEPLLRTDILTGSGFYAEYRTDDARLTIENLKTAAKHGATCINYVKAEGFVYNDGKICGIRCTDVHQNIPFEISTHLVVSAAGPWVDELRAEDESLSGKHLFLSKGVHIVVPHERFPIQYTTYFDVPGGRMLFAVPRQRVTYIGTTDTPYDGDKNRVLATIEDVNYLLSGVNAMFPTVKLTLSDVESSWAGLRPLIHESGKSATEMSRKDEIFESQTGLISIAGGKLTGYRKMAERIMDKVEKRYQERVGRSLSDTDTRNISLTGGIFENKEAVADYVSIIEKKIGSTLPKHTAAYLVSNYGRQTDQILSKMTDFDTDTKAVALARAELYFTIHHEWVQTPLDFFNRRTGRLYFNLPSIAAIQAAIFADFQAYFALSDEQIEAYKAELRQAIQDVTYFGVAELSNEV
ncbi:MAG: glycerol-3-phosphate dehydrogenase/oxidase, partial [Bacteroidota bacterium]